MSKKRANSQTTASPFDLLMQLIHDPDSDNRAGEEADDTLVSTTLAILFRYIRTACSLQIAIPGGTAIPIFHNVVPFAQGPEILIDNRYKSRDLRNFLCCKPKVAKFQMQRLRLARS